jgi:hypothetical protein
MTAARQVSAILALAVIITLVLAAPVLLAPSDRIFGMDLVGRHHDPFTVMEQFARPVSAGAYFQPVTDLPGRWLARIAGPVAAYNWLVLLTFPLSAVAAYLLARHVAVSHAGAAVVAMAFAFSPFHLAHAAYHPHIAQTQWVALYFLALWRCLDRPTAAAVALLVVACAAVTLSNFYGGLIAAVITPVAVVSYWSFISRREPHSVRRLAVTIGSLVVVAVAGLAYGWHAAQAVVLDPAIFGFNRSDLFRYSATWWSYLVPPVANPFLGDVASEVWAEAGTRDGLLEQQVTLGWGLIALGSVAVLAWLIHGRNEKRLAAVPVLAITALAAFVCSLPPESAVGPFTVRWPSAFLHDALPMFRSYARFGVVVQLMAAVVAAIGAERLWRAGTRGARVACVVLLGLTAVEYAVWPGALWRDVLPTPAHRWVLQQAGARALDCGRGDEEAASIQSLTAGRIMPRGATLDDCFEPNLPDRLSATGFTHLLVRHGTDEARWLARAPLPGGLLRQGPFRLADLFVVTAPPPPVYTAALMGFFAREHNEEMSWRWMGTGAVWTVVNRSDQVIVADLDLELWAFGRARQLDLRLDNRPMSPLQVESSRQVYRVGSLTLTPGEHHLGFHAAEPPSPEFDRRDNGDPRGLSFALGTWQWTPQSTRP